MSQQNEAPVQASPVPAEKLLRIVQASWMTRVAYVAAEAPSQVMAWSDLNMLLGPGGRERTEAEFRHLLGNAGFRLARIVPAGLNFSVIEGIPTRR